MPSKIQGLAGRSGQLCTELFTDAVQDLEKCFQPRQLPSFHRNHFNFPSDVQAWCASRADLNRPKRPSRARSVPCQMPDRAQPDPGVKPRPTATPSLFRPRPLLAAVPSGEPVSVGKTNDLADKGRFDPTLGPGFGGELTLFWAKPA